MKQVFIDGSAGTTGLKIYERLFSRKDINLVSLTEENRKDPVKRSELINSSDIVFLCLPDEAAKEAVSFCSNSETVIIDTSTAHRTNDGWTYGFSEIGNQKEKIQTSKRIANPGCHASGFIALIAPLTEKGIISKSENLTCFSLTGYSGGGKKMINSYESEPDDLVAPRVYGLSQNHKHLPEMKKICNLENAPCFSPIVSSYYSGMEVTVPIFKNQINGTIDDIKNVYKEYYRGKVVRYTENSDEEGFLSAAKFQGRDDMEICVFGNEERISLIARFDNLGKGASGAAIQNMNIVMGLDETEGLNIL